jgi:sarcosine oxidase subunit beta
MQRYSIFSLARNALTGHRHWQAAWLSPEPKPAYEVVIVGGGGHGLGESGLVERLQEVAGHWRLSGK